MRPMISNDCYVYTPEPSKIGRCASRGMSGRHSNAAWRWITWDSCDCSMIWNQVGVHPFRNCLTSKHYAKQTQSVVLGSYFLGVGREHLRRVKLNMAQLCATVWNAKHTNQDIGNCAVSLDLAEFCVTSHLYQCCPNMVGRSLKGSSFPEWVMGILH